MENATISMPPFTNTSAQLRYRFVESENPTIQLPSSARLTSATSPFRWMFPRPATVNAPTTDPMPEVDSRIVKVREPPWNTSLAKTGKNVIIGKANMVMQNAMMMRPAIAPWLRMKPNPSFMLERIERLTLPGWKSVRSSRSDTTTAMKDTPFSPKHHAAPNLASATPPRTGPMTRARLNWMEFKAM